MRYFILLLFFALFINGLTDPAASKEEEVEPQGALPWQVQTLAMHGNVGEYSALALDDNGRSHIIYYDRAIDTRLSYGYWDGLIWRFETLPFLLPEQYFYQPGLALAVDNGGNPHVAYYHSQDQDLYYAVRDTSGWHTSLVDGAGDVGRDLSLQLVQGHTPAISYYDATLQELKYARRNGAVWQIETVDGDGDVGQYNSLALDSAGQPHISYYDATNQTLKYARLAGIWQIETVPTGGSAGRGTSLALGWLEQPHIAYVYADPSGFQLHYAQKNGAAWDSEVVSTLNVGAVSLALGPGDVAHIAFDALGRYLYHAQNQTGTWQITSVTTSEHALNPSLAVDAAGRPHLSYYLTEYHDLRYVTQAENWRVETVDNLINNNSFISMAYDGEGSPHLSYNDTGFLTHTGWNGTLWSPVAPLATPLDPRYTSLAYDVSGQPHLAFYNANSGDLFYGARQGSTWSFSAVDSAGDVGQYARLMLSREGTPIVAYWDNTNYQVKVAAQRNGGWLIGSHTTSPPLDADSGRLAAGYAWEGQVFISYYDAPNTDLRVAVARLDGDTWTWQDEIVGISDGHTGPAHDLDMTANGYRPTLVYDYSDTTGNHALRYAKRVPFAGGYQWSSTQFRPLFSNGVISLGLALRAGNADTPRVAYILDEPAQKTLWVGATNGFTWTFESLGSVAVSNVTRWPQPVVLANGVDRVAFVDGVSLRLASRATTQERPFVSADRTAYMTNAESFGLCLCFLMQCWDGGLLAHTAEPQAVASGVGLTQPAVFDQLGALFSETSGGQHYMDLYAHHGLEMYEVMTTRPTLLWDSYRTLHEFMPGLEALVTGRGDDVVITGDMVAHAYDVWLSLSLFGSPALQSAINTELAGSNNLQDFAGMTFNEWARAIGVEPPGQRKLYLPLIRK